MVMEMEMVKVVIQVVIQMEMATEMVIQAAVQTLTVHLIQRIQMVCPIHNRMNQTMAMSTITHRIRQANICRHRTIREYQIHTFRQAMETIDL